MPSSRLDLFVVPADPDRPLDPEPLRQLGVARGWWEEDGHAGPSAAALVEDGFRGIGFETCDHPRFYANQQGGFHVQCPSCDEHVIEPFQVAMHDWREGGARRLTCPHCGWGGPLEALVYRPEAAFACTAMHVAYAGHMGLQDEALRAVEEVWGPVRVIGRRTW